MIQPVEDETPYRNLTIARTASEKVTSVRFSSDGSFFAAAGSSSIIALHDGETAELCLSYHDKTTGHKQGISEISISKDGRYVASASDDRLVKVLDLETNSFIQSLQGHSHYVVSCDFSPTLPLLVSASYDQHIHLWNLTRGSLCGKIHPSRYPQTSVKFNHDGTVIAGASTDGFCRIWDVSTLMCTHTLLEASSPTQIGFCTFSPNGRYLITSNMDDSIRIWDVYGSGKCEKVFSGHQSRLYGVEADFLRSEGNMVVGGSEDGRVCIWDLRSQLMVEEMNCGTEPVISVSSHPTRRSFITGSLDGTVRLWQRSQECLCTNLPKDSLSLIPKPTPAPEHPQAEEKPLTGTTCGCYNFYHRRSVLDEIVTRFNSSMNECKVKEQEWMEWLTSTDYQSRVAEEAKRCEKLRTKENKKRQMELEGIDPNLLADDSIDDDFLNESDHEVIIESDNEASQNPIEIELRKRFHDKHVFESLQSVLG
ncbi:putative Protein will die slowly [Blattamonas nauphoetae]|uniref:WDR5-like beta-propeller domain-containing protein n=1 Tax=Blattamonas nauphoetae TaxID=2049346 RepID=A0ABQ9XYS4_9EUKA|nr:putative Protein will die slowly [Blattamonas nauphoetae]